MPEKLSRTAVTAIVAALATAAIPGACEAIRWWLQVDQMRMQWREVTEQVDQMWSQWQELTETVDELYLDMNE